MATVPEPFLRQTYPGLNEAEDRLLREYLQRIDEDVVALETQVRVGPGERLSEAERDSFRRSWQESSKFKIDAVVTTESAIRLVELKDLIRTSYLGQLRSYRYWYEVERETDKPLELWVVAEDVNPSAVQPGRFDRVNMVLLSAEGQRHFEQGLEATPPFNSP